VIIEINDNIAKVKDINEKFSLSVITENEKFLVLKINGGSYKELKTRKLCYVKSEYFIFEKLKTIENIIHGNLLISFPIIKKG
jgi:hypothetical protein